MTATSTSQQDLLAANALAAAIGPTVGVGMPTSSGNSGQDKSGPPTSISYKGITLTPGGFMAAETVWRQKAMGSDINTPFNSVPLRRRLGVAHLGVQRQRPSVAHQHARRRKAQRRENRRLLRNGLPLRRHHLQQQPEQQLHHCASASSGARPHSTTASPSPAASMWSLITETTHGMDNRTENSADDHRRAIPTPALAGRVSSASA